MSNQPLLCCSLSLLYLTLSPGNFVKKLQFIRRLLCIPQIHSFLNETYLSIFSQMECFWALWLPLLLSPELSELTPSLMKSTMYKWLQYMRPYQYSVVSLRTTLFFILSRMIFAFFARLIFLSHVQLVIQYILQTSLTKHFPSCAYEAN